MAATLTCALLLTAHAHAITVQSNGTGGGDWNTGSTWQGGNVPAPADDVIILEDDTVLLDNATVTRTGSTTINFTSSIDAGFLSVGAITPATLINEGTLDASGAMSVQGFGTLINRGNISFSTNFLYTIDRIRNEAGGTIAAEGVITIDTINFGTITVQHESNSQGWTNSGVTINHATFEVLPNPGGGFPALVNSGVFNNFGTFTVDELNDAQISVGGQFINEEGGSVNWNSSQVFRIGAFGTGGTAENKGEWTNNGSITIDATGRFINGFCGHFTNNDSVSNNGLLSNCGLIDGTTGLAGISGSGTYDTSNCGANTPDATVEVRITDADTGDPIVDTQVFLERVCLPMGTSMPFADVSGGSANFFLDAVEPAQYEIKAFASGYAPFSGRVIALQSLEGRIEDVALTPDPNAVNTLSVTIGVNGGGSLVTDNWQVTQAGGDPFQPTVVIDGVTMNLVGLGFGATQADALVEDYTVTPANVNFREVAPGTLLSAETADADAGDSGSAGLRFVFADPPAQPLTGLRVHFKRRTAGDQPPVNGQQIVGAEEQFTVKCPDPDPDNHELCPIEISPTEFTLQLEITSATYFVVLSNEQNTITSVIDDSLFIAPLPAQTEVLLEFECGLDDLDCDGLEDSWEAGHGISQFTAAAPEGATHDKEAASPCFCADGLSNIEEKNFGSQPIIKDTDGDGYHDGFERYTNPPMNPNVPDQPPPSPEIFVRKNYTDPIRVGSDTRPVSSVAAAVPLVEDGGIITIQNDSTIPINYPGPLTLGTGGKAFTLRIFDTDKPNVRLGASN